MEQDNTAIGLGVPYLILIFCTWLNAAAFRNQYPYYPWVYSSWGGLMALIGCLFLIPVFILTIIFITHPNQATCEEIAFGLAVPAWFLIITGSLIGLFYVPTYLLTPILFFVFICPQIILGFGLFARKNYYETMLHQTPRERPSFPYQGVQHPPRRGPPPVPRRRRGTIAIPEEIRLASTIGQNLKRCVRCGQTLDVKTKICYFCGAPQPSQPIRSPTPTPPATPIHSSPPPIHHSASPQRHVTQYNFCPNCGSRVLRGHLFCTQCGSSLD